MVFTKKSGLLRKLKGKIPVRKTPSLPMTLKAEDKETEPDLINHDDVVNNDEEAHRVTFRRIGWAFRGSVFVNVALGFAVIMQSMTVDRMAPMQRTEPVLLYVDGEFNHPDVIKAIKNIRATPITKSTPAFDLILEAFARKWAMLAYEVDYTTQDQRMKRAASYSTVDVWEKFGEENFAYYEEGLKFGLNRSVIIESSNLFATFKNKRGETVNKYTLVLRFDEFSNGKIKESLKRHLFVDIVSRPDAVPEEQRFENPAGLIVTDFALKKRKNS